MLFKRLILIIYFVLLRNHISSCKTNQSIPGNIADENISKTEQKYLNSSKNDPVANVSNFKLPNGSYVIVNKSRIQLEKLAGNVSELYNIQMENNTKSLTKTFDPLKHDDVANVGDLYNVTLANKYSNDHNKQQTGQGNIAELYDYNFPLTTIENKTDNAKINNSMISQQLKHSRINNIAELYNFGFENVSSNSLLLKRNRIVIGNINNEPIQISTIDTNSINELFSFSSPIVLGMFNCSYDNTINITNYPALSNGSYIYDNHTIIPPDLVGNYDYEVLYDCSKRSVPLHKRACICRLKQCITLCSRSILEFYQDAVNDGEVDEDFMNLFSIQMTLENETVVTKNIAKDFEHMVLDEFCYPFYPLSPEKNENLGWTFFENRTLLRHSDQAHLKKTEYCFELYQDNIENQTYFLINPLNCARKRDRLKIWQEFHYWTQVLSIPFFLITIIAYLCLPELRNVHGKCFMTYLSCLTTSYIILSYINLSQLTFDPVPCLIMGYLNHYMQLSQYIWLGIICFDTWKSLSDYSYKASYRTYAIYGFNLPLLMTFLTFVVENLKINRKFKPGINENRCGLEVNKWAASFYLYGPCLIILIYCLVSFILTSRIIKENNREAYKIKTSGFDCPTMRYTLYLRLFLGMGLSWFLDIVSYFLNMLQMKNFSGLIDYVNALQGLYIFVNFIGRISVRNAIRERFLREKSAMQIK